MGFKSIHTINFTQPPSFQPHPSFHLIYYSFHQPISISFFISSILSSSSSTAGLLLLFFWVLRFSCTRVTAYLVRAITCAFFVALLLGGVLEFWIFLILSSGVFLVWGLFSILEVNDMRLFFLREYCILYHFELDFTTMA